MQIQDEGIEFVREGSHGYFKNVIVTATELENDSKAVLDRVVERGETIQVQRHGKTVAEIKPSVGVSRDELVRILREVRWTAEESRELKAAMDDASKVFGYAGRD